MAAAQWGMGQVPAFRIGGGAQRWKDGQHPSAKIRSWCLFYSVAGVLVTIDEPTQYIAHVSSISDQSMVLTAVGEISSISAPDTCLTRPGIQIGASTSRALIKVPFTIRDSEYPISQFLKEQTARYFGTNRTSGNGFQV
jgi:hypothetical protein